MIFDRVVIDSNALRGSAWPEVSADLENLFDLCKLFRITVAIPEAVELELAEWWRRMAVGRSDSTEKAIKKVREGISNPEILETAKVLDSGLAQVRMRAASEEAKAKWNVQTIPITKVGVDALFRRAASKLPPFDEAGRGFKDAVILFSILEWCSKQAADSQEFTRVALVTKDGDFDVTGVTDLCAQSNVDLEIFGSFSSIVVQLEKDLDLVRQQLRDRDAARARDAISARLPDLQAFAEQNLEISESEFSGYSNVEVNSIRLLEIKDVRTNYLGEKAGDAPKITSEVSCEIVIVCDERTSVFASTPQKLKVGQKQYPSSAFFLNSLVAATQTSRGKKQLPKLIEVEATGTRTKDAYTDLDFTSIKIKRRGYGQLAGLRVPYFGE